MRCGWLASGSGSVPDLATAPMTISAELDAAAALLGEAGVAEPRREANRLWAAIAGGRPGDVWLRRDRPSEPRMSARFRRAVRDRADGLPLAYAAGTVAFRLLELAIDRRALIPRPETEGLVDLVLQWCRESGERGAGSGGVAADVGTGSGCIALALASEGSFERVIATEVSEVAASLARENVARVAPAIPVDVRLGDLLVPLGDAQYRVVVANPPYLTEDEWTALEPAVRDCEPKSALASGADGLETTRRLLAGARAVLEPGGLLAVEIDERRAEAVRLLAEAAGWRVSIHRDVFGRQRYALAV
jgi:release factor glutamine methyltransferase